VNTYRFILIVTILCTGIETITSQPPADAESIPALEGEIQIDGRVDETVWSTVQPLPLTMHLPIFGGDMTESTEIRVTYDEEYLYVGAVCSDSDPAKIQSPTFQRDAWDSNMDQVTLLLDPYNDNENMLVFSVTASGSRIDAVIKHDAQGDDVVNLSWNSYWDARCTVDDRGWQVEIQIPFSSLRFQERNGRVEMGMTVFRYLARKREMDIYPSIPPDWGFWSFAKASQAQTVSFAGIRNKRPWYVSPYTLAGLGHHHMRNENDVVEKIPDRKIQAGLDVQHAFSDNLNADFTVNTDFAQVEADNQVVNLSRYSLFFPEKRRFFLERASIFDFHTDLNNNMFYSRRIGIRDGEMIPLWGGARLVGRFNKWDVGFLNMQSKGTGDFASENFGVVRLRKNVFNQGSYVGGMMTSRIGMDGQNNFVYGVDGIINLFKQDYLQVNLSQSWDTGDTTNAGLYARSRIYLMWEKRTVKGFGYKFSYSSVGENYKPGLGFEQRYNFSQFGDRVFYSWFAPEGSSLRQTTITMNGSISLSNSTRDLETSTIGLESRWEWKRGSVLAVTLEHLEDDVPELFRLSDDFIILPAQYSNTSMGIRYTTLPIGLLRAGTSMRIGTFYGGKLFTWNVSPNVSLSKYFQLSADYEHNTIAFPDREKPFRSHVARLNMVASLNVKFSMSGFVQYNSLQHISTLNFRLRYNPADGNDLYLVYNEVLNNGPLPDVPNSPLSDSRTIMVKYVHTFRL